MLLHHLLQNMLRTTAAQEWDLPTDGCSQPPHGETCTVGAVQPFAHRDFSVVELWRKPGDISCLPAKNTALHRQWSHILETP